MSIRDWGYYTVRPEVAIIHLSDYSINEVMPSGSHFTLEMVLVESPQNWMIRIIIQIVIHFVYDPIQELFCLFISQENSILYFLHSSTFTFTSIFCLKLIWGMMWDSD